MKPIKSIPILLAGIMVAACTQTTTPPTSMVKASLPTEVRASHEPTSTTEPVTVEPNTSVALTDGLGRELTFETHPERIAVAGRAAQLLLYSVYLFPEADERIVAMEQRMQRDMSMIPLVDANFEEKVQFERDVGAEGIAPVQPEAVLMKSYLADSLGTPLETLGITPVYFDLETPEQFFRDLKSLGALFGNPERAESIQDYYQARLDNLEELLEGLDEAERPKVLLLQYSDRGGEVAFNVPSASWLQTEMVKLAGGEPVWLEAAQGGGWTVVNIEQIAAWDPDMIFIVNYFEDPSEVVADLQADPTWSILRAVQGGMMYAFPGDYLSWDQPDPRWILALQWLASRIQPERTASLDIHEEFFSFYQELYELESEVIEKEIVPLLSGDFEG